MSRFERFPERPKPTSPPWDLADTCVVLGLVALVVGVGLVSLGAALIIGGISVAGLAVLWPPR